MEVELSSSGGHRVCIGGISRKHIREHPESSRRRGASQPSGAEELAGRNSEVGVKEGCQYINQTTLVLMRIFSS